MKNANEKIKLTLSFILLLAAALIYSLYKYHYQKLPPGFENVKDPKVFMDRHIKYWLEITRGNNNIKKDIFHQPFLVVFVFDLYDCGLCLARTDEIIKYTSILEKKITIDMICIVITDDDQALSRYLTASPKPCPVIKDSPLNPKFADYGPTPQIIIIDKRQKLQVIIGYISARKITKNFINRYEKIFYH